MSTIFQTSIYSNDSKDNLEQETKPATDLFSKKVLVTSTTPLEPDKAWNSAETLINKDSKKIDEEFDTFTKERVHAETQLRKPTPIPLEPNVLILNVGKNNLDTVKEEENSRVDINTITTEGSTEQQKEAEGLHERQDSPAPLNFQEINRKPVFSERKNLSDNKPFLRDRSASIGTINLKTPIAQLIGEQNRTMLFQVNS